MTVSVAVILACTLCGLAALVGIALQMVRHGTRLIFAWLWLPLGVLFTFAFIPASIGLAEGAWTWSDWRLWAALSLGTLGLIGQSLGWRAILRPRLRPSQCPNCEYEVHSLTRCPECGHPRTPP